MKKINSDFVAGASFTFIIILFVAALLSMCHERVHMHTKYERMRELITELREENRNLSDIVQEMDNVHHHDYLESLPAYQRLHK